MHIRCIAYIRLRFGEFKTSANVCIGTPPPSLDYHFNSDEHIHWVTIKNTKTETVPDKNWEDDEDKYNRSLMVMVMIHDHDDDDDDDYDGDDVANGDCIWKLWETIEQNLLALSYKVQHKLILRSCFDHKMDYHDW